MKVSHARTLNSDAEQVWKAFVDWGGVWQFQPWVVRSPILSDIAEGVGTSRRCEFSDNTSIVETITRISDGKQIEFSLSEAPKPMKSGMGSISLARKGCGTEVTVEMDVTLGMGPFNPLMALMMKPVMRKRVDLMLQSLELHLQTGKKLDPKGNKVVPPSEMPAAA